MAFEEVAITVKVVGSASRRDLNLCAGIAPEFGGLSVRRHFELGNSVDVETIGEELVDPRIDYSLPVHNEIVLSIALAIECCRSADSIRWSAGYGTKKTCEIPAIQGNVNHLPARDDPRSLGR